MESFYLGDLRAVEKALEIDLSKVANKSDYREPDKLPDAKERLGRLTGYRYSPVTSSEAIAEHMNLDGDNKSHSFNVLVAAIKMLAGLRE